MKTLVELAEIHGPTKRFHNYMPIFDFHLAPMRDRVERLLEIGVESGTSLRMWAEYFPKAEIVGLDIDPECRKHGDERIQVVIGNQASRNVLRKLPDFDVVVDDGSHKPEDVIRTFGYLFPKRLRFGGLYFIEDMEGRPRTVDVVCRLAADVNWVPPGFDISRWEELTSLPSRAPETSKVITAVHVYRYIACIEKGRNPEDGEAAYRLTHGTSRTDAGIETEGDSTLGHYDVCPDGAADVRHPRADRESAKRRSEQAHFDRPG